MRGSPKAARLLDVAGVFLKLGVLAFGGPVAHVSMMDAEIVRRRQWLTTERFLDLFGAANLIPGPSSSELALFIGYEQAGWLGLLIAGTCFILPAAMLTTLLAWAYVHYGALAPVAGVLYGVKPVIIAIIAKALWGLLPKAAKSRGLALLGAVSLVASALRVEALLVLLGAGLVAAVAAQNRDFRCRNNSIIYLGALAVAKPWAPITLFGIFSYFLKVGAVVFGSGYVLLAFLRGDLVDRWHWLSESQLLDAIAAGQVTPGPVFTTATFIGYVLAGVPGAAIATIGIFLPGFILVGLSRPLLARIRRSATAGAFLDGVNVAALALMTVVTAQLGRAALVDAPTLLMGAVSLVLVLRWNLNAAWLLLGGAAIGFVAHGIR